MSGAPLSQKVLVAANVLLLAACAFLLVLSIAPEWVPAELGLERSRSEQGVEPADPGQPREPDPGPGGRTLRLERSERPGNPAAERDAATPATRLKPSPDPQPPPTDDAEIAQRNAGEVVPEEQQATLVQDERATIDLFKLASPSVVHITTHQVARDFLSMRMREVPRGSGSGFVWDQKGHIVTNYHVIKDVDVAHVAFDDQSSYSARLVGVAPEKDLAVLRVDAPADKLRPIPVGSSADLEVGRKSFAIGNPFGLDHTLTTGVVSALGREIESTTGVPIKDVIQTDAAINPGNSGGPLLDRSGSLIGVNTAIYSPSGTYAGIGFAIPVDTVRWVVPELIEHGRIIRPGLALTLASDRIARRLGLPGVLVLDVGDDSTAEEAGLRPTRRTRSGQIVLGDIITAIGDYAIDSTNDLLLAFEEFQEGDRPTLTVIRDGEELQLQVELETIE